MTVKELQRLKRQELLQLLLTQSKEAAELQADQEEADREILAFTDSNERLNAKVQEKDVLIDKLSGRLDDKTLRIRELETGIERLKFHRQAEIGRTDSIAGASLRLNGIFAAAQKAIDQYLYNIRQRCEGRTHKAIYDSAGAYAGQMQIYQDDGGAAEQIQSRYDYAEESAGQTGGDTGEPAEEMQTYHGHAQTAEDRTQAVISDSIEEFEGGVRQSETAYAVQGGA